MRTVHTFFVSFSFVWTSLVLNACGPATKKPEPPALDPQEKLQAPFPEAAPCPGQTELECYALQMPLDHSKPDAGQMTVRFAVRKAAEPSSEALLVLFGGPGDPGVYSLGNWLKRVSPELKQRYHIITMDLRGVEGSEAMDCPEAAYNFSFVPPWTYVDEEIETLAQGAEAAATGCLKELGRPAEVLKHYNTKQAAADLESFRRLMGFEAWSIYSLSYGTQLAQTYVSLFPGRTRALVLDGAVDLTVNLLDYGRDLTLAQNKIFADLDTYCRETPVCRAAFTAEGQGKGKGKGALGMTLPTAAYDMLFQRLQQKGAEVRYTAADGSTVNSNMTAYDLEYALSGSVGNPRKRVRFLWALSETLRSGDFTHLYRIADGSLSFEKTPEVPASSEAAVAAPQMSQGVFWTFICNDYGSPAGQTFADRFGQFVKNAAPYLEKGLRIHAPFFSESLCAGWPLVEEPKVSAPFKGEGVPTLVIGAEADANVPFKHSQQIAAQLANGRLITVAGSQHVSYSYHITCVNERVEALFLRGTLPLEKELRCEDEFVGSWPETESAVSATTQPSSMASKSSRLTEVSIAPPAKG